MRSEISVRLPVNQDGTVAPLTIRERLRIWLGIYDVEIAIDKDKTDFKLAKDEGVAAWNQQTQSWRTELAELKERIQDLEDAFPGYKQAKEEADAKPEPLVEGFMPFSQRKRKFERDHRKKN